MTLPPTPRPAATRPIPIPPRVVVPRSRGFGRVRCVHGEEALAQQTVGDRHQQVGGEQQV